MRGGRRRQECRAPRFSHQAVPWPWEAGGVRAALRGAVEGEEGEGLVVSTSTTSRQVRQAHSFSLEAPGPKMNS